MKKGILLSSLLLIPLSVNAQNIGASRSISEGWTLDGKEVRLPFDISRSEHSDEVSMSLTLDLSVLDKADYMALQFDNIAGASRVSVNGNLLGYTYGSNKPYRFEVTPYLRFDGEDTIEVLFDGTASAAGILGDVFLQTCPSVHFAQPGVVVSQTFNGGNAELLINSYVENLSHSSADVTVRHSLFDSKGAEIATSTATGAAILPQGSKEAVSGLNVPKPQMWGPSNPVLYTLVSRLEQDGKTIDEAVSMIGFRTFELGNNGEFLLNGKSFKPHAIDFTQSFDATGQALPDELLSFLLAELKKQGCNMVSTGGHPASEAMLTECDRLGMLVIDESAESGVNYMQKAQAAAMIRQAANHPSVVMWGAGRGAQEDVAVRFAEFARTIDPSRISVLLAEGEGRWHLYNPFLAGAELLSPEVGYEQLVAWAEEPVMYMDPQWSHAGREGKPLTVTVYSNCDKVNVGVNGGGYSTKNMVDGKAQWTLTYKPGKVDLSGYVNNKMVAKKTISTTGYGYQIKVVPNKLTLRPDGEDIIVMDIQMLDSSSRATTDANMDIRVYVDDNALNAYGIVEKKKQISFAPIEILGSDGSQATLRVVNGKARFALRSVKGAEGIAHVRVGGDALHGATFNINYK